MFRNHVMATLVYFMLHQLLLNTIRVSYLGLFEISTLLENACIVLLLVYRRCIFLAIVSLKLF